MNRLFDFRNGYRLGICFLIAAMQGVIFLGAQYAFTGALSFPLDDSFIHLQYGKQIARGYYFTYQDQASISTGETSFLYAHLLALGYLIGFRGVLHLFWAQCLSCFSLAFVYFFAFQLVERWSGSLAAGCAVIVLGLSGYLHWGFWSGMEIALFSALLLGVYYLITEGLFSAAFIGMGFLSLCRPEGGILSATLIFLWLAYKWMPPIQSGSPCTSNLCNPSLRSLKWPLLFLIVCLAFPSFFNGLSTGRMTANSLLAKSLLYSPILGESQKVELFFDNLLSIARFLSGGMTPQWGEFVLPGTLGLSFLGFISLWNRYGFRFTLLCSFPLGVVCIAVATLEVWSLHSFRYLLSFVPFFYLLAVVGVFSISRWVGDSNNVLSILFIILFGWISIPFYPIWITRYAEQSATIDHKQIQTAAWIQRNLPEGAIVAINDAGALAYFGTFPILDLVGLVSNETTLDYRMGEGGLYERLTNLPQEQSPRFAAVFPSWFEEYTKKYDLFIEPMVTFEDPFDPAFEKKVYRINWEYKGMEDEPRDAVLPPGWIVRDRLDIADRMSEDAHQYVLKNRNNRFPKIPIPFRRNFGYHDEIDRLWPGIENEQEELIPFMKEKGILNRFDIVDAGRRITGEEEFTVSHLVPGKEARLIIRTCDGIGDFNRFEYRMHVFVDDFFIGEWRIGETPWNWVDAPLTIPSEFIRKNQVRIRVKNIGAHPFDYFDSYYYWICQEARG